MTLQEFINKWLGKKADFDGAYGGQCVDLFRFYIQEVLENPQPRGVVGAADFWSNYDTDPNLNKFFDKISNSRDVYVQPGDVVLWTRRAGSGFGHVAIALNSDPVANTFVSLDQNWPTLDKVTKTDHNYTNVYGWLRPKENMSEDISIPKATFEDLVGKATKLDAIRTTIGTDSASEIKKDYADYKAAVSQKNEEIKNERQRADLAREELNNVIKAASSALNTVQESTQVIAALSKVKTDLERVEDLERTVAEMQLSSGKEKEELQVEIERLKALVKHGDIQGYSLEEILSELVRRLTNIVRRAK